MPAHDPMTLNYVLFPAAPLAFGAGKPLDFGLGGDSLDFPFPPTLAGALRAAYETTQGRDADPFQPRSAAMGPALLARADVGGDRLELLFARPADAVCFNSSQRTVHALVTAPKADDVYTDLDDVDDVNRAGAGSLDLLRLQVAPAGDLKPDESRDWWTACDMERWLERNPAVPFPAPTGDEGTGADRRTHVVIDGQSKGASAGQIFRSTGRDFGARLARMHHAANDRPGAIRHEYAIAVQFVPPDGDRLDGVARRVGGEGRFALIRRAASTTLPRPPASLYAATQTENPQRVRFVFVTPAVFDAGWGPHEAVARQTRGAPHDGWFERHGVVCRIVAAAIPRAQSYSGWRPGADGRPPGPGLPTRVLPAGTVYWLEIRSGDPCSLHAQSLCEPRHAHDGWGFGLVGVA